MPKVTVTQPGVINVRVGTGQQPTVDALTYGTRSLKSASDLELANASDGDVITYNANTDSFVVVNAGTLPLDLTKVDAGRF